MLGILAAHHRIHRRVAEFPDEILLRHAPAHPVFAPPFAPHATLVVYLGERASHGLAHQHDEAELGMQRRGHTPGHAFCILPWRIEVEREVIHVQEARPCGSRVGGGRGRG